MIIKWKPLVVNLLISLGVGAASALFTMNNMKAVYADLNLLFNKQWYWFSFAWLIVLWFLILTMIVMFSNISRKAALLQIPYLLWVTFAGYLTAGVAILN